LAWKELIEFIWNEKKNPHTCLKKASKYLPGGVDSPVRAFKAVALPRFIEKGKAH